MKPEFEYCRLSKDDLLKGDSYSIQNQRSMLTDYTNKNGFANTQVFIDDGYSGANYDRHGFQEMFEMMEQGQIATLITKDLSRLGRNYLETGTRLTGFNEENPYGWIPDTVSKIRVQSISQAQRY